MSSLELNPDDYPWKIEALEVGYKKPDPDQYMTLDHVHDRNVDYSGRKLDLFTAVGSRFEHCRFDKVRFGNIVFGGGREQSEYFECSFDGIRSDYYLTGFSRFVHCSFRDVDLRGWRCDKTEFIDCVFTGRLEECIFYGTVPEKDRPWVGREKNEFRGNDFSGCDLVDVAFRAGIDLEQQRLPTGPDYLYIPDAAAAIERAKRGLIDWMPGTELQRTAQVLVSSDAMDVASGQRQLLLRLPDLYLSAGRFPREAIDKVIELYRGV